MTPHAAPAEHTAIGTKKNPGPGVSWETGV